MTQAKWWNPPDDQSHLGCFSSGLASQAVCAVPHRREKTPLPEVAKNQDPARALLCSCLQQLKMWHQCQTAAAEQWQQQVLLRTFIDTRA